MSYVWDFSRSNDTDFNDWPDEWQRRRDAGYPTYVKVGIQPHDPELARNYMVLDRALVQFWSKLRTQYPSLSPLPPSTADWMVDRYLAIELDGGKVMCWTPRKPTSQVFQYRFSLRMMTDGLKYDVVTASLVFFDEKNREISSLDLPKTTGTTPWHRVELDRVRPPASATTMAVRISVTGSEDGLHDVRGRIGIDDIAIESFPQLQLTTNRRMAVYHVDEPIVVSAKVLGMPMEASSVHFRLLDHNGNQVNHELVKLHVPVEDELNSRQRNRKPKPEASSDPTLEWALPPLKPGFYRVTASFADDHLTSLETDTTLAVITELENGFATGTFGWSLPRGSEGIDARELTPWLVKLGVSWVKYPLWTAPSDKVTLDENAALVNRFQSAGIQTVGILDSPPESEFVEYEIRSQREAVAANLFRDPSVWKPRLEQVMTQLTLKVRSWQLGADNDHSFMGRPRLRETVAAVRDGLQGFGPAIDVAISWPWLEPTLPASESSWQATCRTTEAPLTAEELDAFLTSDEEIDRSNAPKTWVLLDPVDRSRYDRDTRVRDLVMRMAMTRRHAVQATFTSDPMNPQQGLLRNDHRPGELLLPWRTTSLLLGNLRDVGTLQLRSGSINRVFAGGNRAVLMLWNSVPTVEEMYLGEGVQQVDVWGNVTPLPTIEHAGHPAQRIEIGPMPIFVIGADPTLLAFRMSVAVIEQQLDSILGRPQNLSVVFTNPTRESLVGDLRLRHPDGWNVDQSVRSWELLGGRSSTQTFEVVLGNSAMVGEFELALDFDLQTPPQRQVTIYRKIKVGVEGLTIKLLTRLTSNNELRVVMEMKNVSAKTMAFDCMLFPPPGHQYERRFVSIGPGETLQRDFYFPNGKNLLGSRVLLRAAEQDGRRVMNVDTIVTP